MQQFRILHQHMPLSHLDLVRKAESKLFDALTRNDCTTVRKICHPLIVYTNEIGYTTYGIDKMPFLCAGILRIETVEFIERHLSLFDSVVIVNSTEKRAGTYMGLPNASYCRYTRVWKFCGGWKLISVTMTAINE